MTREQELEELLAEALRHDERGYGPWTRGMRARVRKALRRRTVRRLPHATDERRTQPR